MQYNTHTLANGLRIIHLHSESPVVYCGYAIGSGARHEAEGQEGLAHFCEHTTFKGTEHRSSLQVINALERYGGDLNAFTTKENTFYYAAVLKEYARRAVELLTDIVFHSTYPQTELEKEVEVVCDEIESYRDTPADLIYDEFENEIFSGTSLGHSILGESERVRQFATADCRAFVDRHYVPSNMVFYVYGNVSFSRLVKMLESLTSDLPAVSHTAIVPQPLIVPEVGGQLFKRDIDTHQSHVMMGTAIGIDFWQPVCESVSQGRAALGLLNNILGGPSMNSRFNLSLRERRGLVYSVDSSITTYSDTLLWTVYFGSDPSDSSRCRRLISNELSRIASRPFAESSLRQAKQQLKGQLALASENRENYAIDMAKQYLNYGTLKCNDRLFQSIDSVSAQQLQCLAERFLVPERLATMVF